MAIRWPSGFWRDRELSVVNRERQEICMERHRLDQQRQMTFDSCKDRYLGVHQHLLEKLGEHSDPLHALLRSLLDIDPNRRPTAAEAKAVIGDG